MPEVIDPWEIADQLDQLTEGDWQPGQELPKSAIDDPDWVRRRLIALRFVRHDHALSEERFDLEKERLQERIAEVIGEEIERLDDRRDRVIGTLARQVASLEAQLTGYHRATIEEAIRTGRKPPTSVQLPQGTLKSRAPSVKATIKVTPEGQGPAVAWLKDNGHADMVKVKPAVESVDLLAARKLIKFDDKGKPVGLVTPDGVKCPDDVMQALAGDRRYEIETD